MSCTMTPALLEICPFLPSGFLDPKLGSSLTKELQNLANLFEQEQGPAWECVWRTMDQGGWIIRLERGEFIDLGSPLMIQDLTFWQGLLDLQFSYPSEWPLKAWKQRHPTVNEVECWTCLGRVKTRKAKGGEHVRMDLKQNLPADHNLWKTLSSLKQFGTHQ